MSPRLIAIVILLGGSEALGILGGEWFFRLFVKSIPPFAMSQFSLTQSHVAFLIYGALFGLAVFAWSLLSSFVARTWLRPGSPK